MEYIPEDSLKPLTISKKGAYLRVGMPSVVQAWMYHTRRGNGNWVVIVREGGRGCKTLLDLKSVDDAYELYKRGIKPPPIPSQEDPPSEEDRIVNDDYWLGLKAVLKGKTDELVVALDDKAMGVEWLLAVDTDPADIKPSLYSALIEKVGDYIDRDNGGLSSLGKEEFSDHSKVLSAAERHRRLRQKQKQLVQDLQSASSESPRMVMLEKLTCHPINAQIFEANHDEDAALIRDIERRGLLEPIVITSRYVVISGHRRLRALLALGHTIAPAIISEVKLEDEEESLLAYNLKRHLSNLEKIRVFSRYLEIERKHAALRQHSGKDLPENFPEGGCKGDARDMAGKYVGLSGRSAEMGLRVLREVEKRQGKAAPSEIKTVIDSLNSSIHAGRKAAVRFGWIAELPVKKKPVDRPTPPVMAGAISSASASLNKNPTALRLFQSSLPTVRKALGPTIKPDKVLALRRYGQALISIADQLESQLSK